MIKGSKMSLEQREKMSKGHLKGKESNKRKFNCKVCNKEVIDFPHNRRLYCSIECRNKGFFGKGNPNFNRKWNREKREEVSKIVKQQYFAGRKVWNKNLTKKDERVLRNTIHLFGNKFGIKNKGSKSPWTSKRNLKDNPMHNEEIRRKVGLKLKGKFALDKNPMWKGGLSFEPYTLDWTNKLRKFIRERDKHICQLCNLHLLNKNLDVHHIDYNKKNCNPENLIALCKRCHSKTNVNRKQWIKKFIKLVLSKKSKYVYTAEQLELIGFDEPLASYYADHLNSD